ncbi:PEGA domain-containing protein [Candidatus Kuenenbacteria bacterium]|nr:PEGA domain-containing protein [Candidatus Kuenenbacteria bacterium]
MNLVTRRVIATIFILTFAVCAPILIFYTAGYRYNIKKTKIQKSGALVVDTAPNGAQLYLNNKKLNKKTPVRLNNLLPDEYFIELKKENYYDWSKKLSVRSQETTFAEDIILFQKSEPELISEKNIAWLNFSPDNKFAIYTVTDFSQDYLYLLNLSNKKSYLLFNNNSNLTDPSVIWAKNNSFILFNTKEHSTILPTSTATEVKPFDLNDQNIKGENFKWSKKDSNILYFETGNQVFELNVLSKKTEPIFSLETSEKLFDYYMNDKEIFIIKQTNNKTLLSKYHLTNDNKNLLFKTIELKNSAYKFDNLYNSKLGFNDINNNIFYLVNNDLDKILTNKQNVEHAELHEDANLLLLQTNQELSFLELSAPTIVERNITRYSQGLENAKWHKFSNYTIALQNNKLHIIELDDRDGHFFITLPFKNVTSFGIDSNSENIFFVQDGFLWSLSLE